MSTISQTVKKLKSFDFEKALLKVYKDNETILLDLNTDEQLGKKGILSTGDSLPDYSPNTFPFKQGKSGFAGITEHMTLYGEGEFHEGFTLDASKFPLFIFSTDSKAGDLETRYTDDIYGLTKESIQELKEQLIDEIQTANRKGIGI